MATKKGASPAPLDPNVTKNLLDKLSTDDDFRTLFQSDAHAALAECGYEAGEGATSAGDCLQLKAGATLASKARIASDRTKLEGALRVPVSFACAKDFSAG